MDTRDDATAAPAPDDAAAPAPDAQLERRRQLALMLGYLTDEDVQVLGRVKAETTEAWRKRHVGPEHVMFGNVPLYPQAGVKADLERRAEERRRASMSAKDVL
jgi:hypothetical protein